MMDSTYLILKHFENTKKNKNNSSKINKEINKEIIKEIIKETKKPKTVTKTSNKKHKVSCSFIKSIFGNTLSNTVVSIDESKNEEYSFKYYSSDEDRSKRITSQDDVTMINDIINEED